MNDLEIVDSYEQCVLSTEQWKEEIFLNIADYLTEDETGEAKSILLDAPRVRKLAEWLAVWLAQHEEKEE